MNLEDIMLGEIRQSQKDKFWPWPGGSLGWIIVLYLWVQYPVRAYNWVAGSIPS